MPLEENTQLAPFTTFGIGGPARWFLTAEHEDEIAGAAAAGSRQGDGLRGGGARRSHRVHRAPDFRDPVGLNARHRVRAVRVAAVSQDA